jgi:hypothetical protein
MGIWYILWLFGTYFPVLVVCTKKNLATLVNTPLSIIDRSGGDGQAHRKEYLAMVEGSFPAGQVTAEEPLTHFSVTSRCRFYFAIAEKVLGQI